MTNAHLKTIKTIRIYIKHLIQFKILDRVIQCAKNKRFLVDVGIRI